MQRLGHIDALRGLAALSVVVQHAFELAGLKLDWFNAGRFGVALFFLLSGFVIPFSFSGADPIKRFVVSRFFRLYPAFWASLIAVSLISAVSPLQFAANATMAPQLFGQPLAVGAYWTLFYELCFYFLCIGLFVFGMRTMYIGALALFFAAWYAFPAFYSDLSFIGLMLIGTLLRRTVDGDVGARYWALAAIAGLIVGIVFTRFGRIELALATFASLSVFLLAIRYRPESRLFQWLGKISYSLYLFQAVVMLAIPAMPAILLIGMAVSLSIGLAALSYRYIEAPFIEMGKKVTGRAIPATV